MIRKLSNAALTWILFYSVIFGMFGQQKHQITYGGLQGTQFKATYVESLIIYDGDKKTILPDNVTLLDLNKYSENVKLAFQISNLQLGLADDFKTIKKAKHAKVFFLEALPVTTQNLNFNTSKVKISATKSSEFGPLQNKFVADLKSVEEKLQVTISFEIRIVDGIYNRKWFGNKTTKNFTIIPKKTEVAKYKLEKEPQRIIVQNQTKRKTARKKKTNSPAKSTEPPLASDQSLWEQINLSLEKEDYVSLVTQCKLYLELCSTMKDLSCEKLEDVYYYLIRNTAGNEQISYFQEYKENFPEGQYIELISKMFENNDSKRLPIYKDLAMLDYNKEALVLHNIIGGRKPYYVGIYDPKINTKLPVKKIRFNSRKKVIFYQDIGLSDGTFTIKVFDADQKEFLQSQNLVLQRGLILSNTVRSIIFLIILAVFFFLYRNYVHI